MADRVRVGVIGTSAFWTEWYYLPALKTHPRARLAAICGRNQNRAAELASQFGIPQVFIDYRAMVEQGNLDAVIVAAPDDLHYEMTMCALDAGLHVLCEKPLALNAADARAMYEKAEQVGVKHMALFTYRWMPQFQYVRELVEEGYLGRSLEAHFTFRYVLAHDSQYQWRFDKSRANGALADLGAHLIDMARWYLGDVESVSAQLASRAIREGVDGQHPDPANDSAVMALKFANTALATMEMSAVTRPTKGQTQLQVGLYGESGSLDADIQYENEVRGARFGDGEARPLTVPDRCWGNADHSDPFDVLFKNSTGARQFVDAIVEDRPVSPNFYDGWKAQQVIDAAMESDRTGCWVTVQ